LQQKDAGRGIVSFVDIADVNYDSEQHGDVDFETAMGRIHAVLPDGTVVRDLEVFRRVYDVLGMGWVYAATRLPLIGAIANWIYGVWAARRLALTGRPNLETIVGDRQKRLATEEPGRCRTNADDCDR
jgi:predicted DCC family thiol-disulfide oxidoreductase YuxK